MSLVAAGRCAARDVGLASERLYKVQAPGAEPRLDTIMEVACVLGVTFAASLI